MVLARTSTVPPAPVELGRVELKIPLEWPPAEPDMNRRSVWTVTCPASPLPKVSLLMPPPSRSSSSRAHHHRAGLARRAGPLGRAGDQTRKFRRIDARDQQAVGGDGDLPGIAMPEGGAFDLAAVTQFHLVCIDRDPAGLPRAKGIRRHKTVMDQNGIRPHVDATGAVRAAVVIGKDPTGIEGHPPPPDADRAPTVPTTGINRSGIAGFRRPAC
jgi:hypothetical protein